jgi:hypothetical protein
MNKGYKWEVVLIDDKRHKELRIEFDTLEECEKYEEHIHKHFKNRYRTDIEQIEL